MPWQSGLTGIAYNAKLTEEVRQLRRAAHPPDLKGKVSCSRRCTTRWSSCCCSRAPTRRTSPTTSSAPPSTGCRRSCDAGQVRAFTGNEYAQDLAKGNIVACEAWSGDVIQLQFDNPDIKFVAPEEGLSLWSDNMLVPNKADHKANAEKLMDYYYDPEVAAQLAAWVNYICPVEGAQEAMEKIDPSLVDNALIFPTDEHLSNTKDFMALDQKTEQKYQKQFAAVIGA